MAFIDPVGLMEELLLEPITAIFEAIAGLVDDVSFGIDDLLRNSTLELGLVNLDLSGLTDNLFGEGNTFLTRLFGEGIDSFNTLSNALELTFETLAHSLTGDVFGLLTSSYNILELLAPEITTQVKDSLDGAFDGLGDIFDEITTEIDIILTPLTEELSFFNLSLQSFGTDLISSLKGLFDVDIDSLVEISMQLNKRMMAVRADELMK